jgi:dihydrofolate synthase/folylpolyglutamate synthase
MSYEETLRYIHNVKWQGAKPGLERTRRLLAALGNPEKKLKFVHIAGTNGKGSTAAMIASVLRKAGYRTGLYTSPYIIRFNERMQVDGVHISDEELERMTDEIRPHADAMTDDPPTEFELITALAMKYFLYKECDIVVLEVGMGGELDSTNVIDTPEVAVITAIGLDHMTELGSTPAAIASAKAGIIKENGDVVIYAGEKEVEEVFVKTCLARHARLQRADFKRLDIHGFDLDAARFDLKPYKNIRLPLVGTYQPYNAVVSVTALEVLRDKGYNITDANMMDGLNEVYWPGRFEVLMRQPVFILDGSHNPHGMKATAESLQKHFAGKKLVFLMGVMADKDVDTMAGFILPMAKAFVTVMPHNPRAMKAERLAEILEAKGVPATPCATIPDGVREAVRQAGEDGTVVALGSLYFSGDIREAVDSLK